MADDVLRTRRGRRDYTFSLRPLCVLCVSAVNLLLLLNTHL